MCCNYMVPGLKFNHPKENGSSFPDSVFCQQLLNDGFSTVIVMRKKEGREGRGEGGRGEEEKRRNRCHSSGNTSQALRDTTKVSKSETL